LKRDFLLLLSSVLASVLLLLAGAWSSPTFTQRESFMEALSMFLSLLFVFSVVVVVAYMGFRAFSIFLSLFVAMAISIYGVEAGLIVIAMTYLLWGFVFAIELLLVYHGVEAAHRWFMQHYTAASFRAEYRVFYPMIWIFYFLWDYLPQLFDRVGVDSFNPSEVFEKLLKELEKS